ncbi:MAG TPA: glycosyltransferase family 4 protein [Chthonomonadaceae bacterium]|nr:glycosyltransferase family 4 protein [Chthonomonadaceae bacterium]
MSLAAGNDNRQAIAKPVMQEIFTGRMRPRHFRFSRALERLLGPDRLQVIGRPPSKRTRIQMALGCRLRGFRTFSGEEGRLPCLLHQSLSRRTGPYLAEFDVPLALHNYQIRYHRASAGRARALLERSNLRAVLVFSEWARRSFGLYYGPEVEAKCRVVYPLASEYATPDGERERRYDFCFISTQFRIKSGPELVEAFGRLRRTRDEARTLCVVTDLAEARQLLGDLDRYPGITWREASLSEQEIAGLLADSRCLVHPSLAESFGVVVLEALAAGCALITTDIASFAEMAHPGRNGFLIPAPISSVTGDAFIMELGDARTFAAYLNTLSLHRVTDALEEAMEQMTADAGRLRAMMDASRALYTERFSEEAWQTTMRAILREAFPNMITP